MAEVTVIVRKVQGNVYVVAGAGGNVEVQAGPDGLLLVAVRDAITTIHTRFREMVGKGMTLEQIRTARPSKEWDAKYATENFAPNDMQTSARWYEQMFNEAKAHRN